MDRFIQFFDEIVSLRIFQVGDSPVTLLTLILFFVLISVTGIMAKIAQKTLRRLLSKSRLEEKNVGLLAKIISLTVIIVGFLFSLQFLGVNISSIMGFKIYALGETAVTPSVILMLILFAFLINVAARFSRSSMNNILKQTDLDEGTSYIFSRMTQFLVIGIGTVIVFQQLGINLSSIAVIFGTLSVGIGFGLQNIASNFVSGLILLFERPINVGDRLIVGDVEGDVVEINVRSTTIRSISNVHVIVPNSDFISSPVVNWSVSDKKVRIEVPIGVSYQSDVNLVKMILLEIAEENNEVLKRPHPEVLLREFGDSSISFQLRCWISNPKRHHYVRSDMNFAIVAKFKKHNIEIPFPQRDLHLRSAITLPLEKEKKE